MRNTALSGGEEGGGWQVDEDGVCGRDHGCWGTGCEEGRDEGALCSRARTHGQELQCPAMGVTRG